jgi:hypothetical protein
MISWKPSARLPSTFRLRLIFAKDGSLSSEVTKKLAAACALRPPVKTERQATANAE